MNLFSGYLLSTYYVSGIVPDMEVYSSEQARHNLCLCGTSAEFCPRVGKISWRRERLPTPVFWPGEFHGMYI